MDVRIFISPIGYWVLFADWRI